MVSAGSADAQGGEEVLKASQAPDADYRLAANLNLERAGGSVANPRSGALLAGGHETNPGKVV
eukprot:15103710-Alexandrium_andersonii.AAC.1